MSIYVEKNNPLQYNCICCVASEDTVGDVWTFSVCNCICLRKLIKTKHFDTMQTACLLPFNPHQTCAEGQPVAHLLESVSFQFPSIL